MPFFADLKGLNIQPADYYPAATDYIEQMIKMIEVLLKKGYAYQGADQSIYYSINKFPHYGCLSHLKLDELKAGASVATDEYEKDHVADFVLWKSYDPQRDGEIYWNSPFGKGRPGWHLECSTMAMEILGDTIDLHVGGVDNMFPHHENEIAQSEAYSDKKFVQHWLHVEHLVVDGRKMSKSLGNVYSLRDLLSKEYKGSEVRYMLLQTHYKTQLNFTFNGLEAVKGSLQRLNDFIQRLNGIQNENATDEISPLLNETLISFAEALADDLNISVAIAAIFDLVRELNSRCDANRINKAAAQQTLALFKKFDSVLGILSFESVVDAIPQELEEALTRRIEARKNKDWALSDQLRDLIHSRGYVIEDTPQGARLKKL